VYHVWARGNNREALFAGDKDRAYYLVLLGKVTVQRSWRTMAYCLMSNHLHLLIETAEPDLGVGMQRLQGVYARTFNGSHGRRGHLFEKRFGSKTITNDAQLQVVAAYIALNPVEARLATDPEDWVWSSHAAALGTAPAPSWLDVSRLLGYFASAGGDPSARYARLVRDWQERPGRRTTRASASPDWDDDLTQLATPLGDWERIHSRSVSSPTRA